MPTLAQVLMRYHERWISGAILAAEPEIEEHNGLFLNSNKLRGKPEVTNKNLSQRAQIISWPVNTLSVQAGSPTSLTDTNA
jgi:hypothetical protein